MNIIEVLPSNHSILSHSCIMLSDHSLHHAAKLLYANQAIPILVSPPHHLLHLQIVQHEHLLLPQPYLLLLQLLPQT